MTRDRTQTLNPMNGDGSETVHSRKLKINILNSFEPDAREILHSFDIVTRDR